MLTWGHSDPGPRTRMPMEDPVTACRPARASDLPALAELVRQLGYAASDEQTRVRLEAVLPRTEDHAILIAEEPDGTVTGWIHVFAAHRLESGPFAEIGGLVVGEEHRGGGVGARLLAAARSWAHERGMRELRVRSNVLRERAHRFYEREGFTLSKQQAVLVVEVE